MLKAKIFYIFLFLIVVRNYRLVVVEKRSRNGLFWHRSYYPRSFFICFLQPMFIRLGLLYNKKQ